LLKAGCSRQTNHSKSTPEQCQCQRPCERRCRADATPSAEWGWSMVVAVTFLFENLTIRRLLGVREDALNTLIAALHLTSLEIVSARICAWSQISAFFELVTPWEMRIACHFPNILDTIIMVPGLSVVPERKPQRGDVSNICVQSLALLHLDTLALCQRSVGADWYRKWVVRHHEGAKACNGEESRLIGNLGTLPVHLVVGSQDTLP